MRRVRIPSSMAFCANVEDAVLAGFGETAPELFDDVEPGDDVLVDNRNFVAFCHYFRHNVNASEYWTEDANGRRLSISASGGCGVESSWTVAVDGR